jgi:hypothetical protein
MPGDEVDAHSLSYTTAIESVPSTSDGENVLVTNHASTSRPISGPPDEETLHDMPSFGLEVIVTTEDGSAASRTRKGKRKADPDDAQLTQTRTRLSQESPTGIELTPYEEGDRWWVPCNCVETTGNKKSFGTERDATRHVLTTAAHREGARGLCIYGCGQRFESGRLESMRRHWGRKACTEYRRKHGIEADILPVNSRRNQ